MLLTKTDSISSHDACDRCFPDGFPSLFATAWRWPETVEAVPAECAQRRHLRRFREPNFPWISLWITLWKV